MSEGKIILLDLNCTLVDPASRIKTRAPFTKEKVRKRMRHERMRLDLVEWIRDHRVLLVTARPAEYRDLTLERIAEQTNGWQPEASYFLEDRKLQPPQHKRKVLFDFIFPVYGRSPRHYVAIESNRQTRSMYFRHQISAVTYQEMRDQCPIRNLVLGTAQ